MARIKGMVLETVKRVDIPTELAQDAIESLNLENHIQRAIEKLVEYGAKKSHGVSEVWRRIDDVAKEAYPEFDKNIHEIRFDHIAREVLIQKRVY